MASWIHQPKATILVKVHRQLYPYTIEAFVDSGATRNLFPADVLTYLHIPVDNGQKKIHYGIGGVNVMKPSQNSLFKADTYVRPAVESRILGLVHANLFVALS